jgi:hypothetical protein
VSSAVLAARSPPISCPAAPAVATDAVALCHGVIDGLDPSVRVTFEDGLGHFTLVEN